MVRANPTESSTPVSARRRKACEEIVQAPSTPHRIELRSESTEENRKPAKGGVLPSTKTKRKLKTDKTDVVQTNHKLTEFFAVRRSVRKTTKTVLEERQKTLETILKNNIEEGLEIRVFDDKGRGVVASKCFKKGDFVVEYSGDLIDCLEAKSREEKYAKDLTTGCYMYYFKHNNQQYCIDATAESSKLGRLVNHSRNGNLVTRVIVVDNKPRLVLIAKEDINIGSEILYDYGDRSKESLRHHPWLAC
ncbi:unnamed protein product [Phyllotreta striolata]|uniref:[histone H4]-lysine(20) N-methyltransferase n=1 Tax=Phyllotreta striolata TaxID=444603 RepID=A0A9P0DQX3_PHYSR|nr:unnamed protein product [Phyllotreta striolata]